MSLMNYGFTKSKVDRKIGDDCEVEVLPDNERQEAEMVSSIGKSQGKTRAKSPSKSPLKPDSKGKKENKHTPSKFMNQISPPKKVPPKSNQKVTPKKSSPQGTSKPKSTKDHLNKSSQETLSNKDNEFSLPSIIKKPSADTATSNSLPYQRVKMIMKSCPDVDIVLQESLHLITKATELFVQHLAMESLKSSKTCTLDYESLSDLVHTESSLEFLKETIPKKITWAECQKLIAIKKAERMEEFV